MVEIKRGDHTLSVTMGAFRAVYKSMGYVLAGSEEGHTAPSAPEVGTNTHSSETAPVDEPEADDDTEAEEEEELEEKPVSEMSFRELKEYAFDLGINPKGMSSKELRKAILEAEEEE
jgi:hypothetical protein